jgi:hypothetical protein
MKTNKQFSDEILSKYKKIRKKKNIKKAILSISCVSVFVFVVIFSNIISFNISLYSSSYKKYLKTYISDNSNYAALRIVNAKNAALVIGDKTYICSLNAKSGSTFMLESISENEEENQESIFKVHFSEDKATITGETEEGERIEKILSATDDIGVQSGVWSLFGIKNGENGEVDTLISGAGWILVLENGDSYTGEGIDSVYPSYFIGMGDRILHCLLDTQGGDILDAAVFKYESGDEYDYPVIKESYLSDGDFFEFYYRFMDEDNLFDYDGGTFTAEGVTYFSENSGISEDEMFDLSSVKWRLLPEKDEELSIISCVAELTLEESGAARLTISGNSKYHTKTDGKWFRLKKCILVVLDKQALLTGKAFTIFPGSELSDYTGNDDSFISSAETTIYSYSYYKIGYHDFYYYNLYRETKIYWGEGWNKEYFLPKLIYDIPYVLHGKYFEAYYDEEGKEYLSYPDKTPLTELPNNGSISLIFRTDGTYELYREGEFIKSYKFRFDNHSDKYIDFASEFYIYIGKDKNITIKGLNVVGGGLSRKSTLNYSNSIYNTTQIFYLYDIYFRLQET